jgi:hypothetical protein
MGNPIRKLNRLVRTKEVTHMEALFALTVALVALIGLDMAAAIWGADSRPELADDHRR